MCCFQTLRLIYARWARSVFLVSTNNWCKLHFDWMIKPKQYWFLQCQQMGTYDIWGYVAVCISKVFVAMWWCSWYTHCERGWPYGDPWEGWPDTAAPYGDPRPQWVNVYFFLFQPYVSILDVEKKTFYGPTYQVCIRHAHIVNKWFQSLGIIIKMLMLSCHWGGFWCWLSSN